MKKSYLLQEVTAPCGIDCFNCELFEENITEELKNKIAGLVKCQPADVACKGCRIQGSCSVLMKECSTLKCITGKKLEFCYECDEFPCAYLQPCANRADILPHNLKIFNLCRIRQIGLDAWAKETVTSREKYFKGTMVLGAGPYYNNTH